MLPIRWAISTYTLYDRIEAIHSSRTCRFGHRPLRCPDRGAALGQRECLPCAAARCDGGGGRDAGRIAAVRRHAFRLAVFRFPDTIPSRWQRRRYPSAAAQTAPTAAAGKQQHPNPQREAKEVPTPRPPTPEATQAELVRTEKTEPEKQDQSSERQPAASPPTEQTPEQPNIAEAVAQYVASADRSAAALPRRRLIPTCLATTGPRRSGNVSAFARRCRRGSCPAIRSASRSACPSTATARWRLRRACSCRPHQQKQQALMESAIGALERCQPFTMPPPEKTSSGIRGVYVTCCSRTG